MDDLYPVELSIENLYCFRGKHAKKLEATVYAVLARAEENPARSNWLGKSTFLLAFAFALFGWHTKRTDDEIITAGEELAKVETKLSDGSKIERWKPRGKPMQIRFTPKGGKVLTQAAAQEAIERHIGFSKDDFFMVFFYEQKQIGALVTAKSSARFEMVEGWLAEELEPVQRLHGAAVRAHQKAVADLKAKQDRQAGLVEDIATMESDHFEHPEEIDDLSEALKIEAESIEFSISAAKQRLSELREEEREFEEREEISAKADQYYEVVEKGLALRKEFDQIPATVADEYEQAVKNKGVAQHTCQLAQTQARELEAGELQFDGNCPVVHDACPAAAWVREHGVGARALETAQTAATEAARGLQTATSLAAQAKDKVTRRTELDRELARLREKAGELAEEAAVVLEEPEEWDALGETFIGLPDRIVAVETEISDLTEKKANLKRDIQWLAEALADIDQLEKTDIPTAKERVELTAEAVDLTGRNGAQQAIQELMLSRVEQRANKLMQDADISLQVEICWEQEMKGLAKVCHKCGSAFPTSQRVKQCSCGAARGPNIQRKLSIEPSNRSGAAEDLAGIALGIAASQWLKVHRGARWATPFIDEPFGALDQHNRHALGAHLATMLKTTYCSAFVVAHDRAIMSALPAHINIVADSTGSRLE